MLQKKVEESKTSLEREKNGNLDLLSSQKDEVNSLSEKLFEADKYCREKDAELLELRHEKEKVQLLEEESQSKILKINISLFKMTLKQKRLLLVRDKKGCCQK